MFRDIENVCPADIDRSPSSMFYSVMKQLKIQIVLKHLRQQPIAIDEFEKCVKLLFLSNRGKIPVLEPAVADTYKELMAVPESKHNSSPQYSRLIEKILAKYGKDEFLNLFDKFVLSHQAPVMLDAIIADIESGFYVPRIATGSLDNVSRPESVSVSIDDDANVEKPSCEIRTTVENQPRLQLSAWQLRKGLGLADDEELWGQIHQVLE